MLTVTVMRDFLAYVRKQRAKLQKELSELEVAERVYRQSGVQMLPSQEDADIPEILFKPRKSIKQMVIEILDDMYPHGLTSLEILAYIQMHWKPSLKRESLSPQLTRLKNDAEIYNDKGVWKRLPKTGAPVAAGAPDNAP